MLEFLNSNQGAVNAFLKFVLIVVTAAYVILTSKMLAAQTRPEVSFRIEPNQQSIHLTDLIVENIGMGAAYDIRFEISPKDYHHRKEELLADIGFIRNGIRYLAPRQKMQIFLTDEFEPTAFQAKVTFNTASGKTSTLNYQINFGELTFIRVLDPPPLFRIAQSLEEIKTKVDAVFSGSKRIKIDLYSSDDRAKERKREEECIAKIKADSQSEEIES